MNVVKADYTTTFRGLSELSINELRERKSKMENWALRKLSEHVNWKDWVKRYYERIQQYVFDFLLHRIASVIIRLTYVMTSLIV